MTDTLERGVPIEFAVPMGQSVDDRVANLISTLPIAWRFGNDLLLWNSIQPARRKSALPADDIPQYSHL